MFGAILQIGIDKTLQPVKDVVSVFEGMTEGQLREEAAIRLGSDVVAGMALAEIIEYLKE